MLTDVNVVASRDTRLMSARAGAETSARAVSGLPVLHLLVVDEDERVRNACAEIARKMGFAVVAADGLEAAGSILKLQRVDLILLDLKMADVKRSGSGGLLLLAEVKARQPETSVVVMTAFATVSSAVEAMRVGATDYLTKPFALEELVTILERAGEGRQFKLESRRLRERLRNQKSGGPLAGASPQMEKIYRILSKVANSSHPVLILGESGTGKEVAARSIHFSGPQPTKPFVPVDCGSLVPSLLEPELFGYVKGAFPGAHKGKEGLLAVAEGGTIFLDEVGELPLGVQGRLLKALQERSIVPLGATQAVPIAVRVLASSSRDLPSMVEHGRFRRDLFFRLNVVNLLMPALRERAEDIPILVQHFLERIERETGVKHAVSDDALRVLMEYEWPGNVRELEDAIERACTFSSGPTLHWGDLPTQLQEFRGTTGGGMGEHESEVEVTTAPERIVSMAEIEREAIVRTIRQLKGDKQMAAKLLGIGKTTLYRKLKDYGIEADEG